MDLIGNRSSAGAEEREFSGLLLGLYTTAVAISFRGEDEWGGALPSALHPWSVRCP